jgi:hypothetical protein
MALWRTMTVEKIDVLNHHLKRLFCFLRFLRLKYRKVIEFRLQTHKMPNTANSIV